ncbi:MAG TPA: DNA alkylation repair protein [Acidobacteriota bacterium]|nr:DNA alkylation repair protein [Acidobacteriota bacterium]
MTEPVLSPEEVCKQALNSLEAMADPERAEGGKRFFKSEEPIHLLGIRAPDIRRISKEYFSKVKSYWTQDQAVELCTLLLPNKYLEVKALSLLILERFVSSLDKNHFFLIKEWINSHYCSNWATIDTLCSNVLGPLIKAHPELIGEVLTWADSKNIWLRRASIVSFVKLARQGEYIDVVHKVAEKLFPDKEDLIQKANGWILRESGKTDMNRLEQFLLKRGKDIPRTTLRYAIERFPEKKRKEILKKTKK